MQGEKLNDSKSKKKHGHHHFGGLASTIEFLKREKKEKKHKKAEQAAETIQSTSVESPPKNPKRSKHHDHKSSTSKSTNDKHSHRKADKKQHDHTHKKKHKKHKHQEATSETVHAHVEDTALENQQHSETTDPNILNVGCELTPLLSTGEQIVPPTDEQQPAVLEPISDVLHSASEGELDQTSKLALLLSQETTPFPPLPKDASGEFHQSQVLPSIIITPPASERAPEPSIPPMPDSPRGPSRLERLKNWSGEKFNQGYGLAENYIPGFRWSMNRVVKPTAHGLYTAGAWTLDKTNRYVAQPALNYIAKPVWNKVGSPIWQRTGQPLWNGLHRYILQPTWNGVKRSANWVGNLFSRKSNKPTEGVSTSPSVTVQASKSDVADAALNSTRKGWFSAMPALPLPSFLKKTTGVPSSTSPGATHTEKPKPT